MVRRILAIRHLIILVAVVVSVPASAGAIISPPPTTVFVPNSAVAAGVAEAAPGLIVVDPIQFALQRDQNALPVNPDTRFPSGTRQVWAFFNVREATPGDRLRWIFRFADIDVNWGDVVAETREGRAVVLLERQDGQPLMSGRFDLVVNLQNGQMLQTGSFEILGNDNGGSENDNGDSDNGDSDNEDSDNEDSDNEDSDNEDSDNEDSDNEDSDNEDSDNDDSDNDDSDNEDDD